MMDEEFQKSAIDDAFASFRGGPELPAPIGPAAARATVRRRRQVRTGVTGGLTALLIAAPVAAYAAGVIGTNDPPVTPATAPPSPSATATTPAPTPSAPPSAAPPSSPSVPNGRIDDSALRNARLNLPAWPGLVAQFCPAREYQFTGSESPNDHSHEVTIEDVIYVDADRDGAEETVAMFFCRTGQGGAWQVLAFDRDTDGNIVTLGTVMAAKTGDGEGGPSEQVRDIRAEGNAIAVEIGDQQLCCGAYDGLVQYQWRTYSLRGDAFVQTAGETKFPPNPLINDLAVVSAVLEGTTTGDTFTGTVKVTYRNNGPNEIKAIVGIALPNGASLKTVPMGCKRDDLAIQDPDVDNRSIDYSCEMGPTAVGPDNTLETFQVTGPAATFPAGVQKEFAVLVWADADGEVSGPHSDVLPDLKGDDNKVVKTFTVK